MVKMIMHGCNGRMGQVIAGIVAEDPQVEIIAGVDVSDEGKCAFPVYSSLSACPEGADVVVDFSTAKAVDGLMAECVKRKLPLVLCTTGLNEEQLQKVEETAKEIPVLKSANMSMGINTMMKLLKDAARILSPAGFDMDIVERHHNKKVDAPSGTALALADCINEAMDGQFHYVYDRSQVRQQRDPKEIGISAVRGGTMPGDHVVIFAGPDEVMEIRHTAFSRSIFGKGAVEAAKFLAGKPAGKYDMSDVIG